MDVEDVQIEAKKNKTRTLKSVHDYVNQISNGRVINGIIRSVTKPSYALKQGIGSLRVDYGGLRSENRRRLRYLLRRLVRQHNWKEASGVLSVLLKGTLREKSVSKNRTKYWAAMELLRHKTGVHVSSRKIQHIYELWMKKIGSMTGSQQKDRLVVQLEFIQFCLTHGNTEDAYQGVICLMQERGFGSDPISNLIVGLAFFQLWYSAIPKELQLRDFNEPYNPMQSEMSETRFDMSIDNSGGHDANKIQEVNSRFQCDSNTSVRNDKDIGLAVDVDQQREVSFDVDDTLQQENHCPYFQSQGFYVNACGDSEREVCSASSPGGGMPYGSVFYARGLDSWLLPLRLPHSGDKLEDLIYLHRNIRGDYYNNAVKYLQLALQSTPSVFEALLPLIQILLLGDRVKEALDELETSVHNLNTALPLRLKASLLERFASNNIVKVSTCYEDILKKDPTCSHSLSRLASMDQQGDYSSEKLLEMIALHLDATYAGCNTWKEFASCFLKLCQSEEDRMSICLDCNEGGHKQKYSSHVNGIPGMFTNDVSERTWRFRCRWWLTRHFSHSLLSSEIAAGDLPLLTYKAASASHLYGRELEYVVKASACLEKENNMELFSFLQMHMLNSVGLYLYLTR
ncbi:unnamed protein product [Ilex paraguariensis]|uniref:Uncharacterized protein n=1 Tax=Ilex paraguariensis TaxID=185542 RepID=A0ABC8UPG9_9AQUA